MTDADRSGRVGPLDLDRGRHRLVVQLAFVAAMVVATGVAVLVSTLVHRAGGFVVGGFVAGLVPLYFALEDGANRRECALVYGKFAAIGVVLAVASLVVPW